MVYYYRSPLCLKLEVNSETVTQVKEYCVLGLTIDDELKWQSHVVNVCQTVPKNLFLMSQLKRYVNSQTLRISVNSHIMPSLRMLLLLFFFFLRLLFLVLLLSLIHMNNVWTYVISCVWPSELHGKILTLGTTCKLLHQKTFHTCHAYNHFNLNHFISVSVTLILAGAHKVRAKQTLVLSPAFQTVRQNFDTELRQSKLKILTLFSSEICLNQELLYQLRQKWTFSTSRPNKRTPWNHIAYGYT